MAIEVDVLQESGEIVLVPVSEDVVRTARLLPDEPIRYFLIDENTKMIPITHLVQSRARADGIENAVALMKRAYEGTQPRRKPISIEHWKDGLYLVCDGNSTVTIARAAGWGVIPCIILR